MFYLCSFVNDLHSRKVKKQLIVTPGLVLLLSSPFWRESPMKILLAASLVFCMPIVAPALADPLETANIVQAAVGDFNKDGAADLALLTRGAEDMDLLFFLRDGERNYLKPAGAARGKIWGDVGPDGVFGQEPELKAMANGSIQITTRNDSIGRNRWSQTLTLAYRNTDFIVAGFTYSYNDTLDLAAYGSCDLNVLTGKGIANQPDGKGGITKVKVSAKPDFVPFNNWSAENVMKVCGIDG